MVTGALAVATSSVLIDLSGTTPGTSTFYRCLLAIPVLAVPALRERRSRGLLSGRGVAMALLAGALFAGDALLWTAAIYELGAGLSTVVVNAQVLILPLLALILDREPIGRRYVYALPLMIVGIALTAGVAGRAGTSSDPLLGTIHAVAAALCYSGFLYLLRRGGVGGLIIQLYLWVIASADFPAPSAPHYSCSPPSVRFCFQRSRPGSGPVRSNSREPHRSLPAPTWHRASDEPAPGMTELGAAVVS